jgi:hypothetical protein
MAKKIKMLLCSRTIYQLRKSLQLAELSFGFKGTVQRDGSG